MTKSQVIRAAAGLAILFAVMGAAAPGKVSVEDLLADPEAFEGKTITVEGELVADYGFRSDGSMWTQLNGDSYGRAPVVEGGPLTGPNLGIGLRMPSTIGETLDPPGGYRVRGPIVSVTGVWKYHDQDRQGESYLDASTVETIEAGEELEEGAQRWALAGGLMLLVASGALWLRYVAVRDRD